MIIHITIGAREPKVIKAKWMNVQLLFSAQKYVLKYIYESV